LSLLRKTWSAVILEQDSKENIGTWEGGSDRKLK
jgi:hypothetical protein